MRRVVAPCLGLALLISACGSGAPPGLAPAPTSPAASSTTTARLAATSSTSQPVTTTTPSTTTSTTVAPTTTTLAPSPTTTIPPANFTVVPYFYIDEPGHPGRTGPFLVPMTRSVPGTKAVARAALEQLFTGPVESEREQVPAIATAAPDGIEVLGLTVSDGIATVDLSSGFEVADDAAAVAKRVAQVVFTLSRFPTVQDVHIWQEGLPAEIPLGNGDLVSRPVNIGDYLEFAAALHVEEPAYRGGGSNPLRVSGFGAVFEAAFSYALTDADGVIISEGTAMTTNGSGWGGFDFTVEYQVAREQVGALILWANSAEDGSRIDVREYPVELVP